MGESWLEPRLQPPHKIQIARFFRCTRSEAEAHFLLRFFEENLLRNLNKLWNRMSLGELRAAAGPSGGRGEQALSRCVGGDSRGQGPHPGFGDLLERVTIGDLWFTTRMLWEQDHDELCEDAKAFVKEAERRINKLKAEGEVGSGDRIGAGRGPGRVVAREAHTVVVRVVR
jgi:hypothetical protein